MATVQNNVFQILLNAPGRFFPKRLWLTADQSNVYICSCKSGDPQYTECSDLTEWGDWHSIYVIMKTICPPGYCNNSFMATHALGHRYSSDKDM